MRRLAVAQAGKRVGRIQSETAARERFVRPLRRARALGHPTAPPAHGASCTQLGDAEGPMRGLSDVGWRFAPERWPGGAHGIRSAAA